jgi:hypothetical protein
MKSNRLEQKNVPLDIVEDCLKIVSVFFHFVSDATETLPTTDDLPDCGLAPLREL